MNKTSFFFGAGAESAYGVCTGVDFISALLIDTYRDERKQLLGEEFSNYSLVYSTSTKVFLQTVCANIEKAEIVLGKDITEQIIKYRERDSKQNEENKERYSTIREYCYDWYRIVSGSYKDIKDIKTVKTRKKCNEIKEFFLSNTVFFDSLDEKFNDLRNNPIGANGKRVINAYYTIFMLMMDQVYSAPKNSFEWTFSEVFSLLCQPYDYPKMDKGKTVGNGSYYDILSKSRLPQAHVNIATSNYTSLSEMKTGYDVAYLHGKLTWFEDYRKLQFYDVSDKSAWPTDCSHLIPFIMIPSGVKPVICKMQIDEYSKFVAGLNASDILCVVGYRFNSEDNHINAIIADWLRSSKKHKLVYLNFSSNMSSPNYLKWNSQQWINDEKIEIVDIDEELNFEKLLDGDSSIIDVRVNPKNSHDRFKAFVEENERRQDKLL